MHNVTKVLLLSIPLILCGCSDGSTDAESEQAVAATTGECDGSCVETAFQNDRANVSLTIDDVEQIILQGVAAADAQGQNATIAVVDRVGNVLAVWRTGDPNTARNVLIASDPDGNGGSRISAGLEGIEAGIDALAAIAKAITGAYLSTEGNAFSTRTANQIVQSHFNPGELFQSGGPLFGVQFSQLPCSDFSSRYNGGTPDIGPKRSPLGFSADPGGLPLYKNGTVVGGVGVISDDLYGLDADISDTDQSIDEFIALAASFGYIPPAERRANQITVEGKSLRFTDTAIPQSSLATGNFPPDNGGLIAVNGYTDGTIQAGTIFGQAESGIRPASEPKFAAQDGFVFVATDNNNRYPAQAGVVPVDVGLTETEVATLLEQALIVANRARGQIRQPLGSPARVTISVVDTDGNILGMVRSRDAPVFGADVSLQKARTAAFFSSASAAELLQTDGVAARYIAVQDGALVTTATVDLATYLTAARNFLESPTALSDGAIAFADRSGGNLSRPNYPDGIDGNEPGPFSKPPGEWSPFSTGLQLDLSINAILQHVLFAAGAIPNDVDQNCAGVAHEPLGNFVASPYSHKKLANGLQIFPGSVPIYRDSTLVGGIGISGDGVDQDDMIAFLAVAQTHDILGTIQNAPPNMRADTLEPKGVRLRYVQCPQAPFLDSDEQQPCINK